MTRRPLGLMLTLALLVAFPATAAPPAGKMPRIGYLSLGSPTPESPIDAGFRQGLRELGYIEGQTLVIEFRYAEGQQERLPALAAELVQLPVDLLVTPGTLVTRAAQQATTTLPILSSSGDPVGSGFAASLARPGGNITGYSLGAGEGMGGKWLELLQAAVPSPSRVAFLRNAANVVSLARVHEMQLLAPQLGLHVQAVEVRRPTEFAEAFAAMTQAHIDAFFAEADPLFLPYRTRIVELAATHRLPGLYQTRDFVEVGGLMSYGPNVWDIFRRLASYVDKLLNGAKPGELPIQQTMQYELVINLKTAKALGLSLPPTLLFQADEVIR